MSLTKHRFSKNAFSIDKKGPRHIKNEVNMSNYLIMVIIDQKVIILCPESENFYITSRENKITENFFNIHKYKATDFE